MGWSRPFSCVRLGSDSRGGPDAPDLNCARHTGRACSQGVGIRWSIAQTPVTAPLIIDCANRFRSNRNVATTQKHETRTQLRSRLPPTHEALRLAGVLPDPDYCG